MLPDICPKEWWMSDQSKKSNHPMLPGMNNAISSQVSEAGLLRSSSQGGQKIDQSGPAAAHASHFHRPAGAEALRMSATSGLFGENLSPSAFLQRSLESKLLLRMAEYGSIVHELTWKRWDMPSGPQICALRASVLRISGKGFGGWLSPGHTTRGSAYRNPQKALARARSGHRINLEDQAVLAGWCSPSAQDHSRGNKPPRATDTGVPLSQQVAWTGSRGSLNPELARWLMGFPEGWSNYAPTAMRSCRSSRQSSLKQ